MIAYVITPENMLGGFKKNNILIGRSFCHQMMALLFNNPEYKGIV